MFDPNLLTKRIPRAARPLAAGLFAVVVALGVLASSAVAQSEAQGQSESRPPMQMQMPQGQDPMQQLQAMRQQIQQLNMELIDIQESTLEVNPKLAERRDALVEHGRREDEGRGSPARGRAGVHGRIAGAARER